MKKRLAIVFVWLLAVLMAGCSAPNSNSVTSNKPGAGTNPTSIPQKASIMEQVLYDKDGILVKATSLETDATFGPELMFYIENNGTKNITVQARDESVNGYMVSTVFSASVLPRKKSNDSMTFMSSTLENSGITTFADITFSLHIFNTDTYKTIVDTDPVTIKTSAASYYTQKRDDSGKLLLDSNGIKIIYKGVNADGVFGKGYLLYIENNTKTPITVQTRSESVNGFMMSPVFSCDVMPGKASVDTLEFMTSDFEKNKIDKVTKVEFSFIVINTKTFRNIFKSGTILIEP